MNFFLKKVTKIRNKDSLFTKRFCSFASNQSFDKFVHNRQIEATQSIIVQVNSEQSFNQLYNYCSKFGNIIGAFHYRSFQQNEHYILLQFESAEQALETINTSAYNDNVLGVPVRSKFLWFKAAGKQKLQASSLAKNSVLKAMNGTCSLLNSEFNKRILESANIDEQINVLFNNIKLNDLGIRLRFLAALQVQEALGGMFPKATAQPFGSSVNGFGKMGCDLDLILRYDHEIEKNGNSFAESRLVFHSKENLTNGRSQIQRQMECLSDILHLFLPGVSHVRRILQARVPIIKYYHDYLHLEVDLSISNLSGYYMSELFFIFGELDKRVRPLVFAVRHWAQASGLTNPSPGSWITNFSLSCLVIFFLQQLKNPILPTINELKKYSSQDDVRITENGINCTFVRNIKTIPFQSVNSNREHELLLQFFEFYSQFDFINQAISLNEGRAIAKPDHSPIYIVNPLEQLLNVSKNISHEECDRLRCELRTAAWLLESEMENLSHMENYRSTSQWGLLSLFKEPQKNKSKSSVFFKQRMVEVSELFEKTPFLADENLQSTKSITENKTKYVKVD